MLFPYYETGTLPKHAYIAVPFNKDPNEAVRTAGGDAARLVTIFTSEDEARLRLAQDTDLQGGNLGSGSTTL